jgi:hypothetical protein
MVSNRWTGVAVPIGPKTSSIVPLPPWDHLQAVGPACLASTLATHKAALTCAGVSSEHASFTGAACIGGDPAVVAKDRAARAIATLEFMLPSINHIWLADWHSFA